jgi:beta-lactam-binding protein with PASTA domain
VSVQKQETQDPNEDGIVISQSPQSGAQAKLGSTVVIVVGQLVTPTPNNDTTTTPGATPPPPGPQTP